MYDPAHGRDQDGVFQGSDTYITINCASTAGADPVHPRQEFFTPSPESRSQPALCTLPLELHLLILAHLAYPDMLSLKLASRYFHALIAPRHTVVTRVTWLLDRASSGLPIPKTSQVKLHNDAVFVANAEVREILRARLCHQECVVAWRQNHQRLTRTGATDGGGEAVRDADGNELLPGYCLVRPGTECELRGGRRVWQTIEMALQRGEGDDLGDDTRDGSIRRWMSRSRQPHLQQRRRRQGWRRLGLWDRDVGVVWPVLISDLLIVIGVALLVRWQVSKDWDLKWNRVSNDLGSSS